MPLHDWSTQDDEVFHDFHLRWIGHIVEHLNSGVLPDSLYARGEAGVAIDESDGSDEYRREPDVNVIREPYAEEGGQVLTVEAAPPRTDILLNDRPYLRRQRTVAVRRADGSLVSAIEIVSEANLSSLYRREMLAAKLVSLVRGGVHACLLNVHVLSTRSPSVEFLVADGLAMRAEERPADEAMMTSVVSRFEDGEFEAPTIYADRVHTGDTLRDLPLFISETQYLPLPLETTYSQTFAGLPRRLRETLQAGISHEV